MAVVTSLLPQAVQQDGRWVYSGYDSNNNLVAWPATKNGVFDTSQKSGWATASHNVTAGPEITGSASASTNLLMVDYNGVQWFFPPKTIVQMPQFIYDILTAANSPYTVT